MRNWARDWELCQRATKGPWGKVVVIHSDGGLELADRRIIAALEDKIVCRMASNAPDNTPEGVQANTDMSFIAEAREALPYWLQRVRELELEKIEEKTSYDLRLESQRQLIDNLIKQRDEWSDEAIFMRQRVRELEEEIKTLREQL